MAGLDGIRIVTQPVLDYQENGRLDLSGLKAVCIGRQTRAAADALGMETRMAEKATLDALVDAVVACAAEDEKTGRR